MLNNYENEKTNYQIITSLNNMNNSHLMKEIKDIINIKNINYKVENILNIYTKMNLKRYFHDEITIIYNINNENEIKIFGKTFVDNNKHLCKIIFENKENKLKKNFQIKDKNKDK